MRKHVRVKSSACLAQTCAMRHYGAMTQEQAGGLVLEFGITDRLRKAREHVGCDQKAFAALTGISRGTIGNYENPEWKTRKSYVLREWAMATGVNLHWLKTGEGHPTTPDPEGEPVGDDREAALAKLGRSKRGRRGVPPSTHRYIAA